MKIIVRFLCTVWLYAMIGMIIAPASAQEAAAVPAGEIAPAPNVSKAEDFDDWKMECIISGKEEACSLLQQRVVRREKGIAIILVGRISLLQQKDKIVPHLRLVTPVGVWLPSGLALKLDNGRQINAPFLMCGADGCMTDLGLSEEFLPKVKKSNKLYVAYKLGDQPQTTVELSMKGVTAGLAALSKRKSAE